MNNDFKFSEHSDNYLIHHGVKGQRHGFRRYQNEDGSLTAEGRDHYGVGEARGQGSGSEPKKRYLGGLHDKQGNPVRMIDNVKAGYRNLPRTAKAGLKALFGKKSNKKVAGKMEKPASEKKSNAEQNGNKEKSHKAAKIIGGVAAATAAAALAGYGLKNKSKLKEAASAIKRNAKQTISSAMGKKKNRALSDDELHKLGIQTVRVDRDKVDHVKVNQTNIQRAQSNLREINRISKEREAKMNRVDDQLSRMNRKYGLR